MKTKTCNKCHAEKPLAEFHRDRYAPDGRQYKCGECANRIRREKTLSKVPTKTFTDTQAAYLAALLDGEGCLCIIKSKGKNSTGIQYDVSFSISLTSPVLKDLHAEYGIGRCYFGRQPSMKETYKSIYVWRMGANAMRCVLPQIAPFVRVKKRQVETMLEFLALSHQGEFEKKTALRQTMRSLNKRGTQAYIEHGE